MASTSRYVIEFYHPLTGEWIELRLRPVQIAIGVVRYYTVHHGPWTISTLGHATLIDALDWCRKETTIKEKEHD
jgi:hypothetical protein